jgi:hypothetical protein
MLSACGGDDTGQSSGSSALIGTWVSEKGVTWEVTEDTITTTRPGGIIVSEYSATDTTLELADQSGPEACPSSQPGTYEWNVDGDVLTLTLVTDSCGRANTLNGISFEREQ